MTGSLAHLSFLVLARAGGGEGFPGGDGGGGGGGGDGGGDGGGIVVEILLRLIVQLCFEHPAIGVPLLVGFVAVVYLGSKKGQGALQDRLLVRAEEVRERVREAAAVQRIRQTDPSFEPEAFRERVRIAFVKVEEAWSSLDLSRMRAFVSDGIFERFSIQIEEQRSLGVRDILENVAAESLEFAHAQKDGAFDVAEIRVVGAAVDYKIDLATGTQISGSKTPGRFVEYWSFLRRRGVQTVPGKTGAIEGNCPNCGGPIELNQWARCERCQAFLRNGDHDWVLAEITQASEWTARHAGDLPGVEAVLARDPGFSVQHLEDRASVVFWRWTKAARLGDASAIRKVALPRFAGEFERTRGGRSTRDLYRECAVGAVDTLRVESAGETERATVEVRWTGKGRTAVERTLFVLERSQTATTREASRISSAHCAGCGAPETNTSSDRCEFCGLVQNDGSLDWVLADVVGRYSAAGRRLSAGQGGSAPSPKGDSAPIASAATIPWLIQVAMADELLEPAEIDHLEKIARHAGFPDGWMGRTLEEARAGTMVTQKPADRVEARAWIVALADLAVLPGKVHPAARRVLMELGKAHGFLPYDIDLLLKKARARALVEARRDLRRARALPK